jgi:hypothetical protein
MAKTKEAPETLTLAQRLAKNSRRVSTFTAQWEGTSLSELCGGDESAVQKMHFDESINADIAVFGFSMRTGDKGEFAVIAFSPDDGATICSTTNGSKVIVRKLKAIAEKKGFPVSGRFVKPEGKEYHDFIDCE